jgi:hypothetical protein
MVDLQLSAVHVVCQNTQSDNGRICNGVEVLVVSLIGDAMECEPCERLERLFLESMIDADKAETALRCYLLTHQWSAGVSDMDEYRALRADQQRAADARHRAYTELVSHATDHEHKPALSS